DGPWHERTGPVVLHCTHARTAGQGGRGMQAVRLADVREMTREDWLQARRRGIGGSDIATIAGVNPWSSPVELYLDKLGELPERPETDAMRFGKRLEQVVADEFAERHPDLRVERVNSILQ